MVLAGELWNDVECNQHTMLTFPYHESQSTHIGHILTLWRTMMVIHLQVHGDELQHTGPKNERAKLWQRMTEF